MSLSPYGRFRVIVSGARGAVGIEFDNPPEAGTFIAKAAGGNNRKYVGLTGATPANAVALTDLADTDGSSLVGYENESVENFLDSIIRLGEDVQVTGNTSLDVYAFGRIHSVTAQCNITLPNPGTTLAVGNVIIIRVADNCPGLVTIAGSFAYGSSEIVLWAQESVSLEWTGSYYLLRENQHRRMGGRITREAGNIALTNGVWADFLVDTPGSDRGSFDIGRASTPFYFDVTNKRVTIPRSGQWRVNCIVSVVPSADVTANLTLCVNGDTLNTDAFLERKTLLADGRTTLSMEIELYFSKGTYITPRVRVNGGGGSIDNAINGHVTVLEVK